MPNSSQRQRDNLRLPTAEEMRLIQEERQARDQERARGDALHAEDARKRLQVFGLCMTLLTSERSDRGSLNNLSELTREFAEEYIAQELGSLRAEVEIDRDEEFSAIANGETTNA